MSGSARDSAWSWPVPDLDSFATITIPPESGPTQALVDGRRPPGDEFRVRVLDHGDPGELTVAAPAVPVVEGQKQVAPSRVSIGWLDGGRWFQAPAAIVDARPGPLSIWLVRMLAEPGQRRRWARAKVTLAVDLEAEVELEADTEFEVDPDSTVERRAGLTVDIGEGGFRIVVPGEHLWRPDQPMMMEVLLPEQPTRLRFTGEVLRCTRLKRPLGAEVVIVFDDPAEHGDAVRRTVFAAQRRELALRRDDVPRLRARRRLAS